MSDAAERRAKVLERLEEARRQQSLQNSIHQSFPVLVGETSHSMPGRDVAATAVAAAATATTDVEVSDSSEHCLSPPNSTSASIKQLEERFLDRIAAKPSMLAIRFIGWVLCKVWDSLFSHVWVNDAPLRQLQQQLQLESAQILHPRERGEADDAGARQRPPVTVLLLPTHKSHMDYLLLSWLMFRYDLPMPFIAAGENLARIPLVGSFFRRCGAFYIRRARSRRQQRKHGRWSQASEAQSGRGSAATTPRKERISSTPRTMLEQPAGASAAASTVYRSTLKEYVASLVRAGSSVEFFVEGGRSRDGQVGVPQLGLLTYALSAALAKQQSLHSANGADVPGIRAESEESPRVLVMPVSIDYDLNPDAGEFLREATARRRRRAIQLRNDSEGDSDVIATSVLRMRRRAQRVNRWRFVRQFLLLLPRTVAACVSVARFAAFQCLGLAGIHDPTRGQHGACYVNFSDPIPLNELLAASRSRLRSQHPRRLGQSRNDLLPESDSSLALVAPSPAVIVGEAVFRSLCQSTVVTMTGIVSAAVLWSADHHCGRPAAVLGLGNDLEVSLPLLDMFSAVHELLVAVQRASVPGQPFAPDSAFALGSCAEKQQCLCSKAQIGHSMSASIAASGGPFTCMCSSIYKALQLLERHRVIDITWKNSVAGAQPTVKARGQAAFDLLRYCAGQVALKMRAVFFLLRASSTTAEVVSRDGQSSSIPENAFDMASDPIPSQELETTPSADELDHAVLVLERATSRQLQLLQTGCSLSRS